MKRLFALLVFAALLWPMGASADCIAVPGLPQSGTGCAFSYPPPASAPVGPPTFTYQNDVVGSGTAPTVFAATPAGTPSATRFVAGLYFNSSNINAVTVTSATWNAGGTPVAAVATHLGGPDANGGDMWLFTGVVPADVSGDGITLTVNWGGGGGPFSAGAIWYYTADSSQMVSQIPVTGYTVNNSGASATATVNIAAGGAVLAMSAIEFAAGYTVGFGSPNDPPVAQDNANFTSAVASKNNSAAFTGGRVTCVWTSATVGNCGLATFR